MQTWERMNMVVGYTITLHDVYETDLYELDGHGYCKQIAFVF